MLNLRSLRTVYIDGFSTSVSLLDVSSISFTAFCLEGSVYVFVTFTKCTLFWDIYEICWTSIKKFAL